MKRSPNGKDAEVNLEGKESEAQCITDQISEKFPANLFSFNVSA